jgi:hypothetical protein
VCCHSTEDFGFLLGFDDGMIGFWTWGNIWDESTTWRGDLAFGE